jgi:hypothetical protein
MVFRYCIDNYIVEDMWNDYMKETNHIQQYVRDLLENADVMIIIPDLINFLKNYSNIVLICGRISECLKEVENALLSLDKNYNTLFKFVY